MKKSKTLTASVAVPQDRQQAASTLREIGEASRRIARLNADMNDEIAAIKDRFEAAAQGDRATLSNLIAGLEIWAAANRQALTGGDRTKTVDLGTGIIKWRQRPPRVTLKSEADIIERLKSLGLGRFIRVVESVNKEAMLGEPEQARLVAGVTIGSAGEDFIPEPFETDLAADAQVQGEAA